MMADISEYELQKLTWPSKDKDERHLLTEKKIKDLMLARENILRGIPKEEKALRLRRHLSSSIKSKQLNSFLNVFMSAEIASRIAVSIGSLESLVSLFNEGKLRDYPKDLLAELEDVLSIAIETPSPIDTLYQLEQDRSGYCLLVAVALYANRLIKNYQDFDQKQFLVANGSSITVRNWEVVESDVKIALAKAFGKIDVPLEAYNIAMRAYSIFCTGTGLLPQEKRVIFTFADALRKVLTESVPKYLREAINSTHPFLVRPLFRSYPSALTYASAGKVASSLETIWGEVGEELFLAMGSSLRPVRNGGIDIVHDRDAFDIKSGPAVMNKDQIDILHLKQRIIMDEKGCPASIHSGLRSCMERWMQHSALWQVILEIEIS